MRTTAVLLAWIALLSTTAPTLAQSTPRQRPTQRPTPAPRQRPAQPAPAPKPVVGDTEYKSEKFGLAFRVPKAWERMQSEGDPDSIFFFDVDPSARQQERPVSTRTPPTQLPKPKTAQEFKVFLGQPCERQKDLQEVVKDTRRGLLELFPGTKFRKDEATTIAGHPAWTFVFPVQQSFTIHVVDSRTGQDKETEVKVNCVRQKTLWLQNDTICDYGIEADQSKFPALEKHAAKIRDSFKWTKPANTPAPTE